VLDEDDLATMIGKTYDFQQGVWRGLDREIPADLKISDETLDSECFSGSFHCETLLLSLWAAAQDTEFIPTLRTGPDQALLKTLSTLVDTPFPIVSVSKRSCPACWVLARQVTRTRNLGHRLEKLVVPGPQRKWVATALPHFLPGAIGKACLREVERALVAKLRDIRPIRPPHRAQCTPEIERWTPKMDKIMLTLTEAEQQELRQTLLESESHTDEEGM
jgi:hypothetical protein